MQCKGRVMFILLQFEKNSQINQFIGLHKLATFGCGWLRVIVKSLNLLFRIGHMNYWEIRTRIFICMYYVCNEANSSSDNMVGKKSIYKSSMNLTVYHPSTRQTVQALFNRNKGKIKIFILFLLRWHFKCQIIPITK